MSQVKFCLICNAPVEYNQAGLAKNPKAPTYKCSNHSCKMQYNKFSKTWEPSQYRTGYWDNPGSPSPVVDPVMETMPPVHVAVKNPKDDGNWDAIAFKKCKHTFLIELLKLGVSIDDAEKKAEEWAKRSMRILGEPNIASYKSNMETDQVPF